MLLSIKIDEKELLQTIRDRMQAASESPAEGARALVDSLVGLGISEDEIHRATVNAANLVLDALEARGFDIACDIRPPPAEASGFGVPEAVDVEPSPAAAPPSESAPSAPAPTFAHLSFRAKQRRGGR